MAKPVIIDLDLMVVQGVLERARVALSHEDHACLAGLVQTLVDLSTMVRERGTTIARLRRLFGLHSSEKLRDVFGSAPEPPSDDAAACGPSAASSSDDRDAADDRDVADDRNADDAGNGDAHDGTGEPPPKRKGHGRIGASEYPHARRIHVEHDCLHWGDTCPGCAHGTLYQLREPERIVRVVGQAPLAAIAWECDRLRCSGCGGVFTAVAPTEAQGPKYDERAVAMLALLRYGAGMPLHRLDRLQRNLETPVPASTQWEVVRDHVDALVPIYDELHRIAACGRVLHNDDTSIRILELMGKRRVELVEAGELPDPDRTGLFTTAVISVTDAGPIALFFSGRKHAGENFTSLLERRDPALPSPIHMCDGLDRNRPRGHLVLENNCLAHGRRHIVDEVDNFPTECRHVLEQLGKVFEHEATCRKQVLSDDERLAFHQRESGPVMAALEPWLRAELDDKRIEPNSGLGEAFRYLLKRWTKLTLFLRVPGAPLDNNVCERALKMAIRHRNNSLFYRTMRGAKVGDVYMTLIYTAQLHRENPFEYLVALLVHQADVAADPAAWLPWTFRATLARASRAAA